jgi:phosphate:Na+ symporter
MSWGALLTFAGGVGLFLLGMKLMTDGLKVAAGEALRRILSQWTSSLSRAVLSGVLVTALVQSSSAVVFAVIGFVNAGLLTLAQAVGVIYGAGVGTTMTSWLVAVVGLKVDLKAMALPLVALGMLARVAFSGRRSALGEALAGFGVFFLGIDVLKSAFEDVGPALQLDEFSEGDFGGRMAFVLIGMLLTIAMQSSSAAIAVTLTAVAGGLVPIAAGAALMVGANIGTTSTGLLAVIGATSSAKRAAVSHLVFTVAGGAVAVALLPALLWLAGAVVALAGLDAAADTTTLAVFHTMVALLGLAVVLPATPALTRWLEHRFVSVEEDRSRPRHLDQTVLATPALALDALLLELGRIGDYARTAALSALGDQTPQADRLSHDRQVVDRLALAAGDFASRVQHTDLPADLADAFPRAIRVTQYFSDLAERAEEISRQRERIDPGIDPVIMASVVAWRSAAARLLGHADPQRADFSPAACEAALSALQQDYQSVKDELLRAASAGRVPVAQMAALLDELSLARRALDQALKAARHYTQLRALVAPRGAGAGGDGAAVKGKGNGQGS